MLITTHGMGKPADISGLADSIRQVVMSCRCKKTTRHVSLGDVPRRTKPMF
jgi:hypothetical protein